ncbi:MAG: M67 family metallopeptidase [Chloroflexi bacterium]|nr:M67 family metallopeptidase [Chloroflexota bacterium]
MILTQSQLDQLHAQMRRDAPYETCGMIGGKDGRALKIYPIKNTAENRVKNYFMDGAEQIQAMQDMDDNGYDILAIYHSHPVTPAYPSPTDLRDAWDSDLQEPRYPGTIYIIMTQMNPDAPEAHAYRLENETITEIPIQLVD